MLRPIYIATSLLVALCIHPSSHAEDSTKYDSDVLLRMDREFSELAQTDVVAAFEHFLALDAKSLGGHYFGYERKTVINRHRIQGKQSSIHWWPIGAMVADSDDLGYTWGRYIERKAERHASDDETHGKYLRIWRKDFEGKWKSVVDMDATNPPPQQPGQPK